jgi:hypothetical protein
MNAKEYFDKITADVQPHVPEPVLAVGMFSRPGAISSGLLSFLSPLASMIKNRKAKKRSGGLPQNVVLAVTATTVHVFSFGYRGRSLRIKQEVATWARAGLQVSTEEKSLATRVRFRFAHDGSTVELDSQKGFGSGADFNDEVVRVLAAAA